MVVKILPQKLSSAANSLLPNQLIRNTRVVDCEIPNQFDQSHRYRMAALAISHQGFRSIHTNSLLQLAHSEGHR
jgi:hypothetical protein